VTSLARDRPVSFISTRHPLVTFSIKRSNDASKSFRPGLSSLARMLSMRIGLPVSVDSNKRVLKLLHPWNFNIVQPI
jgi:hypothetical protein